MEFELNAIVREEIYQLVRLARTVFVTTEWYDRGDNKVHHVGLQGLLRM